MSGTPANPSQQPAGLAPAFMAAQVIQAVKENFVVVSGLALIFGVVLATTFLAAYLTIFDWHLLWFVQYTDIITFGLLALGIISGSLIILQALSQFALSILPLNKDKRTRQMLVFGFFLLVLIIFQVWGAVHSGQGVFHVFWSLLALADGIIVILLITGYAISRTVPTVVQIVFLIMLAVLGSGALGQWLGYSVLETETPQDIKINGTVIDGVKVVIVMSRHTVLLKDHDLYVVPTGDISQFHRVRLPWQP